MKLYAFEDVHAWMDRAGYPKVEIEAGYQVIREDFALAFRKGQISFEKDGIYLEYQGKKHRGYVFLKEYQIVKYNTRPKFHIVKCEKIQEFIEAGTFRERYEWSNSDTNTIIDKSTRKAFENEVLSICSYCNKLMIGEIGTTADFAEVMGELNPRPLEIEVDIRGYIKGWERLSRQIREAASFQCASCKIKMENKMHRKYIQVHHKNGNKLDNSPENLQCLCIYCHSKVDQRHLENFDVGVNARELQEFLKRYPR